MVARKLDSVPFTFIVVPGVRGVMSRVVLVVVAMCVSSAAGPVLVSGPACVCDCCCWLGSSSCSSPFCVCCWGLGIESGSDFITTMSMVAPLLSSRVRMVRL